MDPGRSRQAWRRLAPVAVSALIGTSPVIASASASAGTSGAPERGAHAADVSRITLAQAPDGLRAAVRAAIGRPFGPAGIALLQAELTASDGAPGDAFGVSVAISGSTALIGSPHKDADTGAAYVFVTSKGVWTQRAELTASDGAAGDSVGTSVAIDGSTAVLGSPHANGGAGAAYVMVRAKDGTWSQRAKLAASDGVSGDGFGTSAAISGTIAVLGAPSKDASTGAAYVVERPQKTWVQEAELASSGGAPGDRFGAAVAISGPTAIVGADGVNSGTGSASVFARAHKSWVRQAEITLPGGAPGDRFGVSVAISGSIAVVGADGTGSSTGSASAFAGSKAGIWTLQTELTASDGAPGDRLGASVAISGGAAVTGAPNRSSATGAAYAFGLVSQRAELTASDGASGDSFGEAVAIDGSMSAVGAGHRLSDTGAAYVFKATKKTWVQQAKLTAFDGAPGDLFGASVAISGSTVVVGAPGANLGAGAAYVFVRSKKVWVQQAKLTAFDGAPSDRLGASVAISGSFALVGAPGKASGTGVAYVFGGSDGVWSALSELTTAHRAKGDLFGASVAVSGFAAVVGAAGKHAGTGAADVFVGSWTSWILQAELTASDGAAGDRFGTAVAMDGATALVGAPHKDGATGATYVFVNVKNDKWDQRAELTASDGAPGDAFGSFVAVSGSNAVVGANARNLGTGAAYVFMAPGSTWFQEAEITASDGLPGDGFGAADAISGSTVVVGAAKGSATGAAYVFDLPGA
jgi:FG-GAP repeat